MNILLLGGGGREHALAWAVQQNPKCDRLIAAPGNPGIAAIAECAALDIRDGGAVAEFAAENAVDLVLIGPEAPLAAGVGCDLRAAGIACLGPSAAAARLETSKSFAKEICRAAGVPTAAAESFDDHAAARAHLARMGAPIVIKDDGLAAGKGVTVAGTMAEAEAALAALFDRPHARVLIEEKMEGEEASLFVLCDGEVALPVGTARDYKRLGEGDTGPNTGGMGAYSPAPVVTDEVERRAMEAIVRPTLAEMARRGTRFQGVLYAGLMIEAGRPRLVEFNVRFGDPEAQVLAMRLGAQLLDLAQAAAEGRLADARVRWAGDHALTVVMATPGYPGAVRSGDVIGGLDRLAQDSWRQLFHAGTARRGDGAIVAAGGRVLNATARGRTPAEARERAYALAAAVDWPGAVMRGDIGRRVLGR